VRHLVMPRNIVGTESVAAFLARELSPDTFVNLMAQYHPAGKVNNTMFNEINRRITQREYDEALKAALTKGLHRFG
jgi:putative pyruvate formate lyase activating enzyme